MLVLCWVQGFLTFSPSPIADPSLARNQGKDILLIAIVDYIV